MAEPYVVTGTSTFLVDNSTEYLETFSGGEYDYYGFMADLEHSLNWEILIK